MARVASLALVLALAVAPLAPVHAAAWSWWWPFGSSEGSPKEVPTLPSTNNATDVSVHGESGTSTALGAVEHRNRRARETATAKSKVVSVKLQSELQEDQVRHLHHAAGHKVSALQSRAAAATASDPPVEHDRVCAVCPAEGARPECAR
eukprot:CAMPEP_0171241310 /NCGR_PEP_ID=MMETSP0790-20130122/45016_1 /TAXON_ID=2925 /ORGANISM="Alexandrium catenella, Strain OF101" /LENGTH=148 /DNA_ID=CAMNT_0011707889 /DNA_START=88 /DNA_END=531 /DNA_ORIENTATION=+